MKKDKSIFQMQPKAVNARLYSGAENNALK